MKRLTLLALVFVMLLPPVACSPTDEQRKRAISSRAETFARAEKAIPQPIPSNFLARKMLAKYTSRQDVPDHPFYVYILSDVGTIIGYYVAQAAPVNINAFLSSTQDYDSMRGAILTAPSLDGIFYGGSGSSQGGDGWFFFDAASDALIILYGVKMFVADQPLKLETKQIIVERR